MSRQNIKCICNVYKCNGEENISKWQKYDKNDIKINDRITKWQNIYINATYFHVTSFSLTHWGKRI